MQVNLAGTRAISSQASEGEALSRDAIQAGTVAGAARWRQLLDLDAALHAERNIRLLTPEARVLLTLRLAGSLPINAASEAAGVSHRGFYAVLERLRSAGLVATVKDPDDQRVRRLSLDEDAEFGA